MSYRLYGMGIKGWEYITMESSLESLYSDIDNITEYKRIMIIEHNMMLNQDSVLIVSDIEPKITRSRKI